MRVRKIVVDVYIIYSSHEEKKKEDCDFMCVLMSVAGRHGPRQVIIYYNTSPDLCFAQACEVVSHVKEGRVCVIEKWKLRRNGLKLRRSGLRSVSYNP